MVGTNNYLFLSNSKIVEILTVNSFVEILTF